MDAHALRMFDANANRAREGLRVVEDYARFVLDDAGLSRALKRVRHELAAAVRGREDAALAWRDTAGDVGATIGTAAEGRREELADVVRAAGKRVGEALRVLEEVLKLNDRDKARDVERARYAFYDIEKRIVLTLRRGGRMAGVRLYVLVTESACRRPWREVAEAAINAGADCVQLREPTLPAGELLARARWLAAACRAAGAISIVNDRPDVALVAGADGVHVGQADLPAGEARKVVGPDRLVGVSTHDLDQARAAVAAGADYVGVGPAFVSPTKPRDFLPGLPYLRRAAALPVATVAIGGITAGNIADVTATGVTAAAVTAAVCGADDPFEATRALRERFVAGRELSTDR